VRTLATEPDIASSVRVTRLGRCDQPDRSLPAVLAGIHLRARTSGVVVRTADGHPGYSLLVPVQGTFGFLPARGLRGPRAGAPYPYGHRRSSHDLLPDAGPTQLSPAGDRVSTLAADVHDAYTSLLTVPASWSLCDWLQNSPPHAVRTCGGTATPAPPPFLRGCGGTRASYGASSVLTTARQ
jgi:hypothetical protein